MHGVCLVLYLLSTDLDLVIYIYAVPLTLSFTIKGGDPTGTGKGGESAWGGKIKDEFHPNAIHDNRCEELSSGLIVIFTLRHSLLIYGLFCDYCIQPLSGI